MNDISIEDALKKGFWQANATNEKFDSLREALDELGWENVESQILPTPDVQLSS